MKNAPDKATLLAGLARFLAEQVRPNLSDRRLNFRARIAAYLLATLAREVTFEEAHQDAELSRLWALFEEEEEPPERASDRREAIRERNRDLAKRIRKERLEPDELEAIRAHVMSGLIEELKVSAPDFDTSMTPGAS